MYKKFEVYASCYVLNKFVIEIRQRKSRVILHVCRDRLLVDNASLLDHKTEACLFHCSGK